MSTAAFFRLKKLTGGGIIARAARHNRRVIQAEFGATGSIDPARTHLNETLIGPALADDVAHLARDKMRAARRHGRWTGGFVPLGFDAAPEGGKLLVNEDEADRVRAIFELYIEQSEQLPTFLRLYADRESLCGFMLEKLPHADARDPGLARRLSHRP